MNAQLVLKDQRIAVREIVVKGWLLDDIHQPLSFSIDVICEKHQFLEGWRLAPHFYDECFAKDVHDWTALEQQRFTVAEDGDEDSFPTLYLCAHMSLPRSDIRFGKRDAGAGFAFSWNGWADANLSPEYGEHMPFSITGVARCASIEVRFKEPESGMPAGAETAAREVLRTRAVRQDHLAFSEWRRFRDDPADPDFHTIWASFVPRSPGTSA